MTLSEGIKYTGTPFYIPACPRGGLPDFFKEMGFKTGAEIGVYKGKFCEKFCLKGISMYAIDNWSGRNTEEQIRQDYLFEYSKKVLKRLDCNVLRKTSMEAVLDFEQESLDFVYIDSDHTFKSIAEDLYEWYKVVKKGGIISGHDYAYTGKDLLAKKVFSLNSQVGPVVEAFVKAFDIKNFYTFGRSKQIELESKNDRYLSWMFFKP